MQANLCKFISVSFGHIFLPNGSSRVLQLPLDISKLTTNG